MVQLKPSCVALSRCFELKAYSVVLVFLVFASAALAQPSLDTCSGLDVTVTINQGYLNGVLVQEQTVINPPAIPAAQCGQALTQLDLSPGSALEATLTALCQSEAQGQLVSPPSVWSRSVEHAHAAQGCPPEATVSLCVHCFIHGKVVVDPPLADFGVMAVAAEELDDSETGAMFGFGLSGSYRLDERLALGAEMTYLEGDGDRLDVATTNLDLFGRYYLSPNRDSADWFLRAGAGWASISAEARSDRFVAGGFDDSFTAHVGFGVDVPRGRGILLRPQIIGRYYEQIEEVQLAVSLSLAFR